MAVRCGQPIKTSINNINCRPTPVPKAPTCPPPLLVPRGERDAVESRSRGWDALRLINTHVMLLLRMDDGDAGVRERRC